MTISSMEDETVQQILDDMVLSMSIVHKIPLSRLVSGSEQLKRIETKLKSENTNDTN